ncbi:MAG: 4Fe-4S dicluster domain-containing protein [Bacillota bacterium]
MKTEEKKVEIDAKNCKGCELCVGVCPVNIIQMSSEINDRGYPYAEVEDQEKCLSCGRCAMICPDVIIKVYKIENDSE